MNRDYKKFIRLIVVIMIMTASRRKREEENGTTDDGTRLEHPSPPGAVPLFYVLTSSTIEKYCSRS
ncbi:MAG: hypothetical protein ACREBA_00055 [Nitrosotalea sp.]